ncbi:MAG: AMP-binding protein [Candidatus Acidiferrum sp.]
MTERWNNFYDRFAATADRFANHTAIELQHRDSLESVTYAQLKRQSEVASKFLVIQNILAGDKCAILADNEIAWCAVYLGILRLGAVAVPLDTHYSPRQIATLLRDCGPKILFTTEHYIAAIEEACKLSNSTVKLALLRGHHAGIGCFTECEDSLETHLPAVGASRDDPAVILYTSGTTSDPKGVVLTHGNLLAEAECVFAALKLDESDSILGVMPLYHSLAQMGNLLLPFLVGARVIFLEEVSAPELLKALREHRPTLFCCVPQFFYLIQQRVLQKVKEAGRLRSAVFRLLLGVNAALRRWTGLNLGRTFFSEVHDLLGSEMRYLVTGGARFDPSVGRDFYRLGFNLIEAYGLTETSGAATLTLPGEGGQGFVGIPLPGIEVKIVPAEGAASDDATRGEIAIRGPIVMKEYFHRPDATSDVMKDGWLLTGDLGKFDAAGRLSITGRKKEIIVLSSGKNIYPEEIETHYAQSPLIKELCVLGQTLQGEPSAERLHAIIVPDLEVMQARKVLNMKEVLRFDIENLSVHLPAHKRILSYEIQMDPLPRTATRKLKRFEIERKLRARGAELEKEQGAQKVLTEEELAWSSDPFVARALEIIREAAHDKSAVRAEANIELDLGLDSIERVEVLTNLEQLFGARISTEVAQSLYTVRQLVDAFRAQPNISTLAKPANPWSKLLTELPESDPLLTGLLKPHRVFTLLGFAFLKCTNLLARLLVGLHVVGIENLPTSGAYLLCPNHETYIDPFLLASVLSFRTFQGLFYVGASEYFATPLRRKAASLIHLAPVDPDTNLVRALQAGAFGLQHGKVLVLFPEGERSIDGEVKKFKKGAAILSCHLQVPVVPVAFKGVFPIWPRNRAFSWRSLLPWSKTRVTIRFGAPIEPAVLPGPDDSQADTETLYATFTGKLRDTVITLRAAADAHPAAPALKSVS